MSCKKNCDFKACGCIGIIISVILGALIGFLFASDYILFITTAIWIALGLGVLGLIFLLVLLAVAAANRLWPLPRSICDNADCLLFSSIGTIVSAIILLSITLVTTVIPIIIFVSIGAFFLSLTIIALAAFLGAVLCELCKRRRA